LNRRARSWRCAPSNESDVSDELSLAEVPQIDHCVSERFESVVQIADVFETKQQAFKFILPRKHALDGFKTFFKNQGIE
jgi:hypothetical protein